MPPFRRVEGAQAGPRALGILAPPGRRTVVIVRPRALDWDLLVLGPGANGPSAAFWEIGREQAASLCERLHHSLLAWAGGGSGRIDAVAAPHGTGYWAVAEIGPFRLIACPRVPGQLYQPLVFTRREEAQDAAARLADVLRPAADADQELYVNTRDFSR
jgi:hypothetical protein